MRVDADAGKGEFAQVGVAGQRSAGHVSGVQQPLVRRHRAEVAVQPLVRNHHDQAEAGGSGWWEPSVYRCTSGWPGASCAPHPSQQSCAK